MPFRLALSSVLSVFLPLFLLSAVATAEERIGTVLFEHPSAGQPFALKDLLQRSSSAGKGELIAVEVFAAPKPRDGDQNPEFKAQLNFQSGQLAQTMKLPKVNDLDEVLPLIFKVAEIPTEKLRAANLVFDQDIFLYKIELVFSDSPRCDFSGGTCAERVRQLSKLVEFELYAEENRTYQNIAIRMLAAKELTQYPTKSAAEILFKVAQYDGVHIDYDLRGKAFVSLDQIVLKMRTEFGEPATASFLEELYYSFEITEGWMFIVDQFAKFETSAALFFVIKVHTYSPTSKENGNRTTLGAIYSKKDFSATLGRLKERILKEILIPGAEDVPVQWAQERACEAFSKAPQLGTVQTLLRVSDKADNYTLRSYCENAVVQTLHTLDIKSEIAELEGAMIKIITEQQITHERVLGKFFPTRDSTRRMAMHILIKIDNTTSKAALRKALSVPEFEDDLRKGISDYLKASGETVL